MKNITFLLILGFALMTMTCQHCFSKKETPPDNPVYSISFSEGGGFTGLKKGYTIHNDGNAEHWEHYPARDKTILWKKQTQSDKIAGFRMDLEQSDILKKRYKDAGNMTTILTYQVADTTYLWSWKGIGDNDNVPSELKQWFPRFRNYVRSLNK